MNLHAYDIVVLLFLLPCVSAFLPGPSPGVRYPPAISMQPRQAVREGLYEKAKTKGKGILIKTKDFIGYPASVDGPPQVPDSGLPAKAGKRARLKQALRGLVRRIRGSRAKEAADAAAKAKAAQEEAANAKAAEEAAAAKAAEEAAKAKAAQEEAAKAKAAEEAAAAKDAEKAAKSTAAQVEAMKAKAAEEAAAKDKAAKDEKIEVVKGYTTEERVVASRIMEILKDHVPPLRRLKGVQEAERLLKGAAVQGGGKAVFV